MNKTSRTISEKIGLINTATIASFLEGDVFSIIKNFTETSQKILEADFAFAWGRFNENEPSRLIYKSPNSPDNPAIPKRKKRDVRKSLFDTDVTIENYISGVDTKLKSYLIIPINYGDHVYGCIVVCYEKKHVFSEEDLALSETIGNTVAEAITIAWLVEKEHMTLSLAEKQKETEVLLAQEKLKSEFIANATHEIRTPLAIMKGNVDLALMSKGDLKTMKTALKEVNEEIVILADILKDLALLIASNKNIENVMGRAPINLREMLDQTVRRLQTLASEKDISIKFNSKDKSGLIVLGDENYLEKLFLNLIKNAITYGKSGGKIMIEISKDKKNAIIKIADNGIGISKEDLPYIFERFYRADKAHSSHGSHSGLGLAIAKWVAEIHGGEIKAESKYGKGSVFTVTLPLYIRS